MSRLSSGMQEHDQHVSVCVLLVSSSEVTWSFGEMLAGGRLDPFWSTVSFVLASVRFPHPRCATVDKA